MRLGCHLSVSKGFDKAAEAAHEIGANTFQFFTRNPRGGAARAIPEEEVAKWREARQTYDIAPIVGHLPYTVNMAAPAEKSFAFANMVVAADLARMDAVGAEYLVIHPGSHAGSGREAGLRRIVSCLEESFIPFTGKTMLLLETMAKAGSEIGTLDDIKLIMDELGRPDNLGVCIDSCHLTGAGYDFMQKEQVDRLADDLQSLIGLE
ncbi:MAG: deoxyribonuclease IV, partial [Bacillota bacterium]|nr:deoxyribonuclease IV [Bacillota bacterium]